LLQAKNFKDVKTNPNQQIVKNNIILYWYVHLLGFLLSLCISTCSASSYLYIYKCPCKTEKPIQDLSFSLSSTNKVLLSFWLASDMMCVFNCCADYIVVFLHNFAKLDPTVNTFLFIQISCKNRCRKILNTFTNSSCLPRRSI